MILVIDNYDSFVHNLARYLERLGQATTVVRNDAISPSEVERLRPSALVLSPGPCTPNEAGCSLQLVRHFYRRLPILGICLGHQTIGAALGGRIVRAIEPMHGRVSQIHHNGRGVFQDIASPFAACRYHSLVVEESSMPDELEITARAERGTIMAIEHRQYPVVGLQFHPESILTDCGYALLRNFLKVAGLSAPGASMSILDERHAARRAAPLPTAPVTF